MKWYLHPRNWALAYVVLLTFGVRNHSFFWDTVQLASKHAHFYLESGFMQLFLPDAIDSGHPPTFGVGLAILWYFFGKSLWISHLYVLPALVGSVILLWRVEVHLLGDRARGWMLPLLLFDPIFAGQSVLVSPDLWLVFALLLCLENILSTDSKRSAFSLSVGALLLAAISTRGMMVCALLYPVLVFVRCQNGVRFSLQLLLKIAAQFVPAGIFAASFIGLHYYQKGWIGYHESSPWAESFSVVEISDLAKNIGILGWRLMDFGRIFVCLLFTWILFVTNWKSIDKKAKILIFTLASLSLLAFVLLPYRFLLAHRYLFPVMLLFTMLTFYLWHLKYRGQRALYIGYLTLLLGLGTGNFWVYPNWLAQGWDATLAHLPHYGQRAAVLEFLNEKGIVVEEVGTVFPEIGPLYLHDLSTKTTGFHRMDWGKSDYFYYSFVMNDIADENFTDLRKNWTILKTWGAGNRKTILYQRKID